MKTKAKMAGVSWMAGALLPLLAGLGSAVNPNATLPPTEQPMQQNQQMATPPEPTPQSQPQLERAKEFLGAKVVNQQGERLGTVKDVVLTPDRNGINYVVLSHDSGWGMAEKYFAVPWSQFAPGEDSKTFILKGNISKADLNRAPGFDKKHWPAMANENWLGTERSSSMPSSAEQGTPGNPMYGTAQPTDIQHLRLSKLMGTTVRDAQNENIGKLENAMIDLNQGKMAYGIVAARHKSLGAGKDLVAVPWSALNWTDEPGIAQVNVDRETLASVAFRRDNFPNLADPQYSRQLFARFHATPYWETPPLGFIPGQENRNDNRPSSEMAAPNTTAPNSAVPQMVADGNRYAVPPYGYNYNPYAVQTFQGAVSRVITGHAPGTSRSMDEMGLIVQATNGRRIQVALGPRYFVESQRMFFQPGEWVTVTGSLARVSGKDIFLAARIQTPYRVFRLRTSNGTPLWSRGRPPYPNAYGRGYDQYDRYAYPYPH
jgi:sporulation protein YlmC with PRC-barrel domain